MTWKEGEKGKQGDHGQDGMQGKKGDRGEVGRRGPSAIFPWIILVIAFTVMGVVLQHNHTQTNRLAKANSLAIIRLNQTVNDLKVAKANVKQLQKSNCTLRYFLATARRARYESAKISEGQKAAIDDQAVKAYTTLIIALDGEAYCPLPQRLELPQHLDN